MRLPRDHYVRVDSNDYSVHPAAVGRTVQVVADLATVTVTCAGTVVAAHDRCWARHQSITDPAHHAAALALAAPGRASPTRSAGGRTRSSSGTWRVYDAAFGVTDEEVA